MRFGGVPLKSGVSFGKRENPYYPQGNALLAFFKATGSSQNPIFIEIDKSWEVSGYPPKSDKNGVRGHNQKKVCFGGVQNFWRALGIRPPGGWGPPVGVRACARFSCTHDVNIDG